MALQSFKLTGNGCGNGLMRFKYTCVELIPRKNSYFCDYRGGPPTIDAYLSEQNGVQMYKRDLPNYAGDLQKSDPAACMRLCDGKGSYRFFAIQRVQTQLKCFCGDSFGQPSQLYPKVQTFGHPSLCSQLYEGVNQVYTRADSDQLTKVKAMCKEEDEKEANCAEEAVMDFYKHDICMGASCSLAENAVASMIISLVIWIADEIIGCALGFWCKPSFWISVTKGSTGNDAEEASGTEKIASSGVKEATKGTTKAMAQKALYTGAEKALQKAADEAGKQAVKEAVETAVNQGAGAVGQFGAESMAKAKNFFKNMVPCLPAAVLAILDGGATFGSCMIMCLKSALGVAIGKLVFQLIRSCLWDIIKNALSGCFPADATVQLSSGQTVPMVKLQIGDEVLAGDGTWSTVYVMSHQDSTRTAEFVELKLKNHTIVATEGHFLPVSKMCDEASEDMRAGDVAVGMCLFTMGVGETRSSLQQVLTKGRVFKKGLFNPFTMQGTLAVNGVVASSHSEWFLDNVADSLSLTHLLPTVYQAVLAPARGLYSAVTWLVGIEKVKAQLEEYKTDMALATENNFVFKPYFDLFVRAVKVVSSSIGGHR